MPAATMTNEIAELQNKIRGAETQAKDAYAKLSDAKTALKEAGPEAMANPESAEFKALDTAGREYDGLKAQAETLRDQVRRIAEIEGVVAPVEGASNGDAAAAAFRDAANRLSPAQRVVTSDAFKAMADRLGISENSMLGGNMLLGEMLSRDEFKNLVTGASDTSAGAFVITDRRPEYIDLNRRPLSILNLVSVSTTDSDKIDWVRQTTRPTSAAFVPEATSTSDGAKPQGSAAWEVVSADVETIAEWIPLTRRAARDAGRVEAILNDELVYDLYRVIENSMLTGDGTGEFLGIENTSGIGAYTIGTTDATENKMDAIHRAITLGRVQEEEPDGVMLNPEDWEDIRLAKNDNGDYLYGPPSTAGDMQIWGKPVVLTNAQGTGKSTVGNFRRGAEIAFNGGVQAFMADQHDDFFVRNLKVLLAEIAAAFLVKRPKCFAVVHLEA